MARRDLEGIRKFIARDDPAAATSFCDKLLDHADGLRLFPEQGGNLLEGGRVQKIANRVHINVQLIRAATDEHLWAESYNRTLDDVFAVEGEVAFADAAG